MTHKEIKQRIQSVLNAMDSVSIAGVRNRQTVAACETILTEILRAPFEPDQLEK